MKRAVLALSSLALLGLGFSLTACKSAPDLSQSDALSMIQANYDAAQPGGLDIIVNSNGMVQGANAKYWSRTKVYPNKYWADFTLTPDGKKVIKVPDGGDVIKWRPGSPADDAYTITISTVAPKHLKPHDLGEIQSVGSKTKTVSFTESVDFTGIPQPVQDLAHMRGNTLTANRTADFTLENGAWKLQSVQ